ncbi:unnamed protein product [Schistosoma margrebowiei]|uniref:Uncharacterized protein n=1 Tax=Schistosoma margrebowiei TaxID=48269 RepID=A0A183M069_9TREM|nr:unnamed protein product [Schistosoma margrebowiei]
MESSGPNEKRKTKKHITPGNGDRHEKNEQELDRIRREGLRQSGLENAGRRPMLHYNDNNNNNNNNNNENKYFIISKNIKMHKTIPYIPLRKLYSTLYFWYNIEFSA